MTVTATGATVTDNLSSGPPPASRSDSERLTPLRVRPKTATVRHRSRQAAWTRTDRASTYRRPFTSTTRKTARAAGPACRPGLPAPPAAAERGQGIGRALIEAVYAHAKKAGSERVYWMTHESNAQARTLYDKIADRSGFIQYRKAL